MEGQGRLKTTPVMLKHEMGGHRSYPDPCFDTMEGQGTLHCVKT